MITSKKSHTPQGLDKNLVLQEPSFIVKNLSYKTRVKLDVKNPGWRTHNSSAPLAHGADTWDMGMVYTGVETVFFVFNIFTKKERWDRGGWIYRFRV